jgi:ribosome biogenesis GTPase / thiamine phosphate phosphatase
LSQGIVLWGSKSIYYVLDADTRQEFKCLIKGKVIDTDFDVDGRKELNPIVVGDIVEFQKTDETNGLITERKKRKNEFKRLKSEGRYVQTLFANVDDMLVVDSIAHPPLRPYFIDRALFTADYMGIPAVVVFNKIDLLDDETRELYILIKNTYEKIGFSTFETSAATGAGISELKEFLKGKISCMSGRSGVGKSSLISALDPLFNKIRVGEINKKYDRGIHTTTIAKIYALDCGANLIDTPGVRELSIYIDKPEDVEKYIRDFVSFREKCRFDNCQHINEPDCAVLKALDEGGIEEFRYESYLRIRETISKLDDSRI